MAAATTSYSRYEVAIRLRNSGEHAKGGASGSSGHLHFGHFCNPMDHCFFSEAVSGDLGGCCPFVFFGSTVT